MVGKGRVTNNFGGVDVPLQGAHGTLHSNGIQKKHQAALTFLQTLRCSLHWWHKNCFLLSGVYAGIIFLAASKNAPKQVDISGCRTIVIEKEWWQWVACVLILALSLFAAAGLVLADFGSRSTYWSRKTLACSHVSYRVMLCHVGSLRVSSCH